MAHCPRCREEVGWRALLAGGGIVCPGCHAELDVQRWSKLLIMMAATTIALFAEDGMSYLFSRSNSVAAVLVILPLSYFALASLLLRYRVKPGPPSISSASQTNPRQPEA